MMGIKGNSFRTGEVDGKYWALVERNGIEIKKWGDTRQEAVDGLLDLTNLLDSPVGKLMTGLENVDNNSETTRFWLVTYQGIDSLGEFIIGSVACQADGMLRRHNFVSWVYHNFRISNAVIIGLKR